MSDMRCGKCGARSGDDWSQCNKACPMPGSPHYDPSLFVDGDRVRIKADMARGFHQPFAKLIAEGREGTLHVYTRSGWDGPVANYEIVFDVKRSGAKPHRLVLDPKHLERIVE